MFCFSIHTTHAERAYEGENKVVTKRIARQLGFTSIQPGEDNSELILCV
jgi:hypothetical protein